jgi:hypothetical protein
MRWVEYVAYMGDFKIHANRYWKACREFVQDVIKMEVRCERVDRLNWLRVESSFRIVLNTGINGSKASGSIREVNSLISSATVIL